MSIAAALDDGSLSLESSPVGIAGLPGVRHDLASQTYDVFQSLAATLNATAVSVAIRTAVEVRDEEHLGSPQVEVCWTGPDAEGPLVTPTALAVRNLIESCHDVGEILLVGYSFAVPKGSFMEEVVDLLEEASRRRARIRVVLHQDDAGDNQRRLREHWDPTARRPDIYTWDPPPEHPYTKLHAKCLVVDKLQMLVTSANFTFHGLESNIELGLLVRNQPLATAVHRRFEHLIANGVLRKWES
ncbi:MAG: hypothetical protein KC482_01285 [Dehalococcoidia bacterium]|nr:hypothetical protein [Dehalococcoidia bacterium]